MADAAAPVLLTGGLGAIGSWVVRRLLAAGRPFTVYEARADYSLVPDLRGRFPLVVGDVLDRQRLAAAVRECGARRIIHLAALMPPACEADPTRGYQVNLLGSTTVFDVARECGVERVVFGSSKAANGAILGAHADPTFAPIPEEYQGPTLDVYGATKRALEDAARHYRRLFGLDLIALRFGTTYGPGKLERHGAVGLKSRIVETAFRGEPFTVPTPDLADDAVYNRDVAKAVVLACDAPRSEHWQFHISGGQLITLRAFVAEVVRHCPQHRLTLDETARPPEGPGTRGLLDNSRARAELGYVPDFPGATGVADYVAWLRATSA